MEPRGQLWFELQRVCDDFLNYSGLEEREALRTLISVLGNLQAEQEEQLARLESPTGDAAGPPAS